MANKLQKEADRRTGVTVTMRKADQCRLDNYISRIRGQNNLVKIDRQTVIEGLILQFLSKSDNLESN